MLQYVRTLAEIQASPFQPNAPVRSSDVLSLTGLSTRKRSEIALALARSGPIEAQRSTYCSISDPQPKLLRFVEETDKTIRYGGQLKTSAFDLPEDGKAVVHLEALPNHRLENEAINVDVLCVHEDGTIRCYNEALTSEKWNVRTAQKNQELHVVYTSTISIQHARQTVLKSREDILSSLDAGRDTYTPNLLLLLTRSDNETLSLRISAIRNSEATSIQGFLSKRSIVEELVSFTLPEPNDVRGKEASFRLHKSNGSLYQGTPGNLCVYDLTALAPQLVQTMNFPNAKGVLSYIRISSDLVATMAPDSMFLIDTRFSSFQANYALPTPKQARGKVSHDIKAKSPPLGTPGVQLLSYHSPSSSAIVLFGRNLIAVDVSTTIASRVAIRDRKRKRNGLLIDAIGRDSISVEDSLPFQTRTESLRKGLRKELQTFREPLAWKEQRLALEALLEKGDQKEWDSSMASAFASGNDASPPDYKVDYVLGKMFFTTPMEDTTNRQEDRLVSKLHLEYLPEQTWHSLIHKGLITIDRIHAALKRQARTNYNNEFRDSDLIQALVGHDPSLASLLSMLQSPCLLKVSQICHALKITVTRSLTLGAPDGTKLLTQGHENDDPKSRSPDDMHLVNGVSDDGSHQTSGEFLGFHALLDAIIGRCNACSAPSLTKALQMQLSRDELRSFINMLRIKLAQNGWLLPYTENPPSSKPNQPYSNSHLSTIGHLLNCCVDSLGSTGWLLNNDTADDSFAAIETVSFMKAEISAAVAGVEEANFLQGVLGEALLCGRSALNPQAANRSPLVGSDWGNSQKAALPLGLKLDHNISLTKVGAGGELQKRSRRDIGKLKSRKVPEYSFEHIAI
ncbi:MAG: hypothetical protein LQ344_003386 [Seirophora lacunosa]|nr:MAG: hypothetical protein LQ344_003386 [Seirophora lacunosa]